MCFQIVIRGGALAAVVLAVAATPVGAASILGQASLSGEFVPLTTVTDTTSPISIVQSSTVSGAPTGTVLGTNRITANDSGFFALGSSGQKANDHEAAFSFSDTITNTGTVAAGFTMDFLISAGALETIAREIPPRLGSDPRLQAGYDIAITADGSVVFASAATLFMNGNWPTSFTTTASVTRSGVDLGGVLTHPETGAPDRWLYQWGDYLGSVNLGVLAPGGSVSIEYAVRTFVRAGVDRCSNSDCAARASIGDPFNVHPDIPDQALSSIGGAATISSTPVSDVPEPTSLGLLAAAAAGLLTTRRRRR